MSAEERSAAAEPGPSSKRHKEAAHEHDDDLRRFYRSWAWKREHLPDKHRFHRPYKHTMTLPGSPAPPPVTLSMRQSKFGPEGFASTVWDSAIVAAKFVEKCPVMVAGRRCLDLSAGCGLVAVVMAKLGAHVTATDLASNLPLLRDNCIDNGVPDVAVVEHRWGSELQQELQPAFDVIVACDIMYIDEIVPQLIQSLLLLSHQHSTILIAHGRNRPAESPFKVAAAQHFDVSEVPGSELDEVYQCSDVDVLRLRRRAGTQRKAAAAAGAVVGSKEQTAAACVQHNAAAAAGGSKAVALHLADAQNEAG